MHKIYLAGRSKRKFSSALRLALITPAVLFPFAIIGPNTILVLYAITVLSVGILLLWRPGEPQILFFIFVYQWLQSATGAIYGNALGVPIDELSYSNGLNEFASGLMLTGVLALALGMRVSAGRKKTTFPTRLRELALSKPFSFWIKIYIIAWLFSAACSAIAPVAGGLSLPFITLAGIKWAGFVLLTFATFVRTGSRSKMFWLLIFFVEFAFSIGGFFSDFKQVFIFSFFGLALANLDIKLKSLIPTTLLTIVLIWLALVWSAIKVEYRFFQNAGSGQQVALLTWSESVDLIGRLISKTDGHDLENATTILANRVSYHSFFGAAALQMQGRSNYTGGEIWFEAMSRPLMPRFLFPNKRAINDSDLTNQYTGLGVASADQGASISLGYMAEAYIDFGPFFMFLPILILGFGVGFFYRWLVRQPSYKSVVGASLAPFALMPAHLAETSILKMLPALILTLFACIVVLKFLSPIIMRGLPLAKMQDRL